MSTPPAVAVLRDLPKARLFWPIVTLVALLLLNFAVSPGFFAIRFQNGHLFGSLVDILRNGAPTLLVALGMTVVIATRGIDLSVGAVVAISGALACTIIADSPSPDSLGTVLSAVAVAIVFSLVLGAWNGLLVAVFGIQPIIATLILMTAGRGIAMLITEGNIITISSAPEIATTAPTERSMPRVAITTVMPSATSSVGAPLRRMSIRLPNRCPFWKRMAKKPGDTAKLSSSSATSVTIGQNSRARGRSRRVVRVLLMLRLRSR